MNAAVSLIPELEEVLQRGSRQKRAEMLTRITNLFLDGASRFNDDHVQLFDGVIGRLVDEIETKTRAELANRLAPIDNAPTGVIRRLATDDDIAVAAPVLQRSPRLDEADLVDIASSKGQPHLLAIAGRPGIDVAVTEILVRRGDRAVVRHVAANAKASFSDVAFRNLVRRAGGDSVLAENVGGRADIPPSLFRVLLDQATEVVRKRLLAQARPEVKQEISRVVERVSGEVGAQSGPLRDLQAARREMQKLQQAGRIAEKELRELAERHQHDQAIATLAAMSAVPVEVIDRLMSGDRPDPVLILCRACDLSWPTARALLNLSAGERGHPAATLDKAFQNFERLTSATAQRVMRFWQARQPGGGA